MAWARAGQLAALVYLIGFCHIVSASDVVVGTSAGSVMVSPTGAGNYTMPIVVPPGTAGLQPQLSVAYSSQAGDGYFGKGFSLGGLSQISRCSRTIAQDGFIAPTLFSSDTFCLDGQRLLAGAGVSYGKFKTEIESFSDIARTWTQNDGKFTVRTKSGLTMQFGSLTSSQQIGMSSGGDALTWFVDKVSDTAGNYMSVTYQRDASTGEVTPLRIDYTGNTTQTPFASVVFNYDNKPEGGRVLYVDGTGVAQQKRISKITASSQGAGRTYYFAYDQGGHLGATRLRSITECAFDSRGEICFPATAFEWAGDVELLGSLLSDNGFTSFPRGCLTGDLNADGRDDMWCSAGSYSAAWQVYLSSGVGFLPVQTWTGPAPGNVKYQCFRGDLNGDGRTDTWCSSAEGSSTWHVAISTGSSWVLSNRTGGPTPGHPIYNQCMTGDVNGDARTDMMCSTGSLSTSWQVTQASEVGWTTTTWGNAPSTDTPVGSRCMGGDFNGDGRTDLACVVGDLTRIWQVALSTGNGWQKANWPNGPATNYWNAALCFAGELNGDGITDLWCSQSESTGIWDVAFSTGRGWALSTLSGGPGARHPVIDTCTTGDVNGDGRTDTFCSGAPGSTTWNAWVFNGLGWAPLRTFNGPPADHPISAVQQGDLNGDGQSDLWMPQRITPQSEFGFWRLSVSLPRLPDVISAVMDGLGARTELSYEWARNSAVYSVLLPPIESYPPAYPDRAVTSPMLLVSELRRTNGLGGLNRLTYKYTNAVTNLLGRGFLGFLTQTVNDVTTGFSTTTRFQHYFPVTGTVTQTDVKDKNGRTISSTTFNHGVVSLGSPVSHFVFVAQSIDRKRDPQSLAVNVTTQTTNEYAEPLTAFFGNLTKSTVVIEGSSSAGDLPLGDLLGYVTTTENTYENDTVNWWLGRLTRSTVTRRSPDTTVATSRTSAFEYSTSTGLLSAEIVEPDLPIYSVRTDYERDNAGNIVRSTVSAAEVTTCASETVFDVWERYPVSRQNCLGHREFPLHAPSTGKVQQLRGPNNTVTMWEYDQFGRLTKEIRPDSTWTTTRRYPCGVDCPSNGAFKVNVTASDGAQSESIFDLLGRDVAQRTLAVNGSWTTRVTEYDIAGRAYRKSAPSFGLPACWTTLTYDDWSRLTAMDAPISQSQCYGRLTTTSYSGLTITERDPGGHSRTIQRDPLGKIVLTRDDSGKDTSYVYDAWDNLTEVHDPAGNATRMAYDLRGRKIQMVDPDMGTWEYGYDVLGRLTRQQDARGLVSVMSYDPLGRMTSRVEAEGLSTWTYDSRWKGALSASSGPEGFTRELFYNALGQVVSTNTQIDGFTHVIATSYDAEGHVREVRYPSGLSVTYDYSFGHIIDVRNPVTGTLYWHLGDVDALGNATAITMENGSQATTLDFDDATGLLGTVTTTGSGGSIQSLSYVWDLDGNLDRRVDNRQAKTERLYYDRLHRLTYIAGSTNQSVVYDAIGNITYKTGLGNYVYGVKPHAVAMVGDLTKGGATFTYDANGNMIAGSGRSIIWTSYNKPATIMQGAANSSFYYDPDRALFKQRSIRVPGAPDPNSILQALQDEVNEIVSGLPPPPSECDAAPALCPPPDAVGPAYDVLTRVATLAAECLNGQSGCPVPEDPCDMTQYCPDPTVPDLQPVYDVLSLVEDNVQSCLEASPQCPTNELPSSGALDLILGMLPDCGTHCSPEQLLAAVVDIKDFACSMLGGDYPVCSPIEISAATSSSAVCVAPQLCEGPDLPVVEYDVTTHYVGGLYEFHRSENGEKHVSYIRVGGKAIAVVTQVVGQSSSTAYLHYDHLGSVDTATNASGAVIERLSYDAFGLRRKPNWDADYAGTELQRAHTTNRGFTSHEQLDHLRLVHMGGRVYDPMIGRFMSADPFVQMEAGAQGLNRYSYVVNNPLTLTDPSGYAWKRIENELKRWEGDTRHELRRPDSHLGTAFRVGVAVGSTYCGYYTAICLAASNGALTKWQGGSSGDVLRSAVMSAALYGANELVGSLFPTDTLSGATQNAIAHGVVSGAYSAANGGEFDDGFLQGVLSTALAPAPAGDVYVDTAIQAVLGGTFERLGGGKFANGAITASFAHLFNYMEHNPAEGQMLREAWGIGTPAEARALLMESTSTAASFLIGRGLFAGVARLLHFGRSATTVDQVIASAGKLDRLKGGALQGRVSGDADVMIQSLTKGAERLPSGAFRLKDGTYINLHRSTATGVPTIDINRAGAVYKIRVDP